ncbi:MAG TPA: cupin domain-containing protein [Anaerolineae bacterium]|nr:cupin domain-containing protein [Anaerolineae bacterium]
MVDVINLADKLTKFDDLWSPRVIAGINNYQVKLVKVAGEFVWHQHDDTDELFLVVKGELMIDFEGETICLKAGEMVVVPRGVRHRPRAEEECHILLLEPEGLVNTGDAGGALTADNDVWI